MEGAQLTRYANDVEGQALTLSFADLLKSGCFWSWSLRADGRYLYHLRKSSLEMIDSSSANVLLTKNTGARRND